MRALLSLGKGLALYKNAIPIQIVTLETEKQRFINSKLTTVLFVIHKQNIYSNESEGSV